MMVLSMLIFGGQTLHYFALALTIGILFGIYSSVFVAAAIAMWLGVKREDLITRRGQGPRSGGPERRSGGVESNADSSPGQISTHPMPTPANPTALAQQARRSYVERLLGGMPAVVQAVDQGARTLAGAVAEPAVAMKRREIIPTLQGAFPLWLQGMTTLLRATLATGTVTQTRLGDLPVQSTGNRPGPKLSLVDDDTIEHEILSSRLALAMMDRASWEFTDLRSRMNVLEGREELDANDILRPHVLARVVTNSWLAVPLGFDAWRLLHTVLHDEFSHFAEEAYHETNRFLLQRHVLPEVDLRPFIRRSNHGGGPISVPPRSSSGGGGFGTPTGTARERRVRLPVLDDEAGQGARTRSAKRRA